MIGYQIFKNSNHIFMKKTFFFLFFAIPFFCMAQLPREYDYDAAGNRILRKTITLTPAPPAPPTPEDSLYVQNVPLQIFEGVDPQSGDGVVNANSFTETLAQTEIKIYPNPTTEQLTLEIAQWENLQTGNFTLYSLNGQLLQEHPVRSATTVISLAGLPKGAYLLKVHINGKSEEWKVIKN